MYEIGDYVIHRKGGVWRVADIQRDAPGANPTGYLLSAHENSENTINVPVDSGEIVRKIIDKEALSEALERIPYIRTIQAPKDKLRKELYDEAMSKYDEIEWLRVIKSVYLRRGQKRLMPSEMAYLAEAQRYLHGEASVLLEISSDSVEAYIAGSVANVT
ncbi:MAG: CarD family transcriptional regulator [Synergistaceae bacterium]|jgi:CarD family transcriptional regulator|nr:CarD family transcriptional regulator [Synergistaceae bacterium]